MEKEALKAEIKANPYRYVAQQRPRRSTTPVWHDGELRPWHVRVTEFHLQTEKTTHVLPGGLVRVSPDAHSLDRSPSSGRLGQDCWIVSDETVDDEQTLLPATGSEIRLSRSGAELPSRVAENLFWLGRSAERTEAIARLLRVALMRIVGENDADGVPEIGRIVAALCAMDQLDPDHAIEDLGIPLGPVETAIPASIFDQSQNRGLRSGVLDMVEKAAAVHDRIHLTRTGSSPAPPITLPIQVSTCGTIVAQRSADSTTWLPIYLRSPD